MTWVNDHGWTEVDLAAHLAGQLGQQPPEPHDCGCVVTIDGWRCVRRSTQEDLLCDTCRGYCLPRATLIDWAWVRSFRPSAVIPAS